MKTAAIIGGGPAGLMAAEVLSGHGLQVDVYDSMSSLGRKFLMAGKSGLNLTHSEPFGKFVSRYGSKKREVEKWLLDFTPDDLREWARGLGVETFVGTSGRVFPNEMKASPLLRAWLKRLDAAGVQFHLRHKWNGILVAEDGDKSKTVASADDGGKSKIVTSADDDGKSKTVTSADDGGKSNTWNGVLVAEDGDKSKLDDKSSSADGDKSGSAVTAEDGGVSSLGVHVEFETPDGLKTVHADAVILSLGGGSWARLGSSGEWVHWLDQAGVKVEALKASNCGFDVAWSPFFKEKYDGQPIKSVVLTFGEFHQQGEFIVTKEGVEGSLVYAASAGMRDEILANGKAVMRLDLAPDKTEAQLLEKLLKPRGSRSMASHLEKTVGMKGVKAGLLREFVPKDEFADMARLAFYIKQLPVPLAATRPLDEAISSAGGVCFESLDEGLMLKVLPGVFCAGEMLDWEAPTGGYLLTACFASGRVAANGVLTWLGMR